MINIEDVSHLIPSTAGKVVGVASYRGDYIIVACEHAILRLWDDGIQPRMSSGSEADRSAVQPNAGT
jgi:hypothetical protein